jgi:hypothetical protein
VRDEVKREAEDSVEELRRGVEDLRLNPTEHLKYTKHPKGKRAGLDSHWTKAARWPLREAVPPTNCLDCLGLSSHLNFFFFCLLFPLLVFFINSLI